MNYYYYLLLCIAFFTFAKQSQILLKIKDSYLSTKGIYKYYLVSIFIGYVILFISVFSYFRWFYALLIIVAGFTILPFIISLFIPIRINKLLESDIRYIYFFMIISVIISILLFLHLL